MAEYAVALTSAGQGIKCFGPKSSANVSIEIDFEDEIGKVGSYGYILDLRLWTSAYVYIDPLDRILFSGIAGFKIDGVTQSWTSGMAFAGSGLDAIAGKTLTITISGTTGDGWGGSFYVGSRYNSIDTATMQVSGIRALVSGSPVSSYLMNEGSGSALTDSLATYSDGILVNYTNDSQWVLLGGGGGGSTVEAAALYSNISSMLSGKIGTLNASVDISSGYTDVDAGDVNYNAFSNFNTVTNYSSPSGSIVEVSTTFSTSSDMGNAPVSDVISLVDFNTILNSTSLANIIANATLVNSIQSGFVVDRDCILNDSILFNVSSNYISTTGDTGVSAIAAITSAYSMLAGNYALTGAGISSVLSSIAQSVGISNQFAGIVDANNVSVLASGGQTNSSNCSFSLSSSDASISSISIEAIADYSTSLNLLCAVVSNMEASADYMSVANLISSNLSILNAQSSFGISSDLSVTRTMTTSAGATISVTCGYTTSGIQFTSTEVLTPDSRMVRVLSEGRIIRVLA